MINKYIPYEHAVNAFDCFINECNTVQEANTLFKAKAAVTSLVCNLRDLQPVKHGHWETTIQKDGTTVGQHSVTKCSECGYVMFLATRNFCPNCGARMGGE